MNVISAFGGTGKSVFARIHPTVTDLDNQELPKHDYLAQVLQLEARDKLVLSDTSWAVREGLVIAEVDFVLVYPDKSLCAEYLERYRARGDSEDYIELVSKNWNQLIEECVHQRNCRKRVLKAGEYLSDVIAVENNTFVFK